MVVKRRGGETLVTFSEEARATLVAREALVTYAGRLFVTLEARATLAAREAGHRLGTDGETLAGHGRDASASAI